MSDNMEVYVPTTDVQVLAKTILVSEWMTWDETQGTAFFENVRQVLKLAGMLRTRIDEQLDAAHNVGKFSKVERIRKARTAEDGPKVDPLAELLGAFE